MISLPLSPNGRRYGYRKSPVDHRDYGISRALSHVSIRPGQVDLESFCGPVKDQGQLGACTAFAGCGNREYLARKFGHWQPVFSPLFLYYMERKEDGTLPDDAGSDGRTSCRVMAKYGICTESEDIYDPVKFNTAPTPEQLDEAALRKAGAYHRINSVDDMKSCLASDYPILIGFAVYESFEKIGSDGLMPAPNKDHEQMLGGHETLVIGYDDAKRAFKVRNSWGADWGDKGNFWMPYTVAADASVLWDAWMQHLGPAWKPFYSKAD